MDPFTVFPGLQLEGGTSSTDDSGEETELLVPDDSAVRSETSALRSMDLRSVEIETPLDVTPSASHADGLSEGAHSCRADTLSFRESPHQRSAEACEFIANVDAALDVEASECEEANTD
jgi:hypothetical protein